VTDLRSELLADAYGFMVTQSIGVVARAGVADLVADGHETIGDLAAETGLPADSLRRIIRALAALEIFTLEGDHVRNTPKSELLRAEVPGSVYWIAQSFANEHYRVWGAAEAAFRDGEPATPDVLGSGYFDWLAAHPAEAAIFNRAMAAGSAAKLQAVERVGWTDELVVDVGGGTGGLLSGLLTLHPALRGVVYDLPHSEQAALATFEAAGVADRCTFVSGNFFESVPPGGDAYVLSHILHDWDDEHSLRILGAIRAVADDATRLVIMDSVLRDEGTGALVPKLLDLHMLVMLGGRERTADEWALLLRQAGFSLRQIHGEGVLTAIEAGTIAL
jgi:hypothetical protein